MLTRLRLIAKRRRVIGGALFHLTFLEDSSSLDTVSPELLLNY